MTTDSLASGLQQWARVSPERVFLSASTPMTFRRVNEEVERRAERLMNETGGAPILLAGVNNEQWIINLLAALQMEIPVTLVPPAWMPTEEKRLAEVAQAALRVEGEVFKRIGASTSSNGLATWKKAGAALGFATSGSTGQPRLALRSHRSLVDEGERYRTLWKTQPDDSVIAALPLAHAYTFGAALATSLVAGLTLVVEDFNSPRRLANVLSTGRTTILPLVGSVARALARLDAGRTAHSKLRIAMVGAGVVTPVMSQLFNAKWNILLSQNYGSSETGAVLASCAPESTRGTGFPLAGVECEIVSSQNFAGQLWVRLGSPPLGYLTDRGFEPACLSPGGWWATGDLFCRDEAGLYTMMGRLGREIRRGGHTIHPREVETAVASHPAVEEVLVQGDKEAGGEEVVVAHVLLKLGATASTIELRDHLTGRLAAYKCPTHWDVRTNFPRTWSGKITVGKGHPAPHRGRGSKCLAALWVYRLSHALMAAESTGLLKQLSGAACSLEELAARLGLDRASLSLFLNFLTGVGFVRKESEGYVLAETRSERWEAIFALETQLHQSWLTADAIEDVLRRGLEARRFNRTTATDDFVRAYQAVMCGPSQVAAIRHVMKLINLKAGARVLEIGRGIGMLSNVLSQQSHHIECELVALSPAPAIVCHTPQAEPVALDVPVRSWSEIEPQPNYFDLILITNGIHWLHPSETTTILPRLVKGLAPKGHLLLVDIFLPELNSVTDDPSDSLWLFFLDWLTHGGTNLLTASEAISQLKYAGLADASHHMPDALAFQIVFGSRASEAVAATPGYLAEIEL